MNRATFVVVVLFFAVPVAAAGLININTATQAQLEVLNGIGPTKAKAIIEYREVHGPFARIEDIVQVSGIGPKTFEDIRASITVEVGEEPLAAPVVRQAPAQTVNIVSAPAVQETPVAQVEHTGLEAPALPLQESSSATLLVSLGALAVLLGGSVAGLRYLRPQAVPATFPTAEEFEIES